MGIRIIEEPEISLTRAEYERLFHEYQKAMSFYAGPNVSFETWVRGRLKAGVSNYVG